MAINYKTVIRSRTNFEIVGSILVNASAEAIWQIFTTPGHLKLFHPFCKSHQKVKSWREIGDVDTAEFYNGKKMQRRLIGFSPLKSYTIQMENKDGKNTQVCFRIKKIDTNTARASIHIKTDAYRKIPRPFWPVFVRLYLRKSYKNYLNSILNGLKYYSETGKPVSRNQFGSHKKFSPEIN